MFSINKTSLFSAVFLSLALSFSAQAEDTGTKAAAAPVVKAEQSASKAKKAAKASKSTIQTIECSAPFCPNSFIMGGGCVEWCGGCPGDTYC